MKLVLLTFALVAAVFSRPNPDVSHIVGKNKVRQVPITSYGAASSSINNNYDAINHHPEIVHIPIDYIPATDFQLPIRDAIDFIGKDKYQISSGFYNNGELFNTDAESESVLTGDVKHSKQVYFYSAPEADEPQYLRVQFASSPVKNTNVIFVKAPAPGPIIPQIITPKHQAIEDKTKVYVLVKESENLGKTITLPAPIPVKAKPEVYIVKYKNQDDAQRVIASGVAEHEVVGSSVHDVKDEQTFVRTLNNDAVQHVGLKQNINFRSGFPFSAPRFPAINVRVNDENDAIIGNQQSVGALNTITGTDFGSSTIDGFSSTTAIPLPGFADVSSQGYIGNIGGQFPSSTASPLAQFADVSSPGYINNFGGQFPSTTASPVAAYADINSQSYINNFGGQYSGKSVNSLPAFADVNSQAYVRSFGGQFPSTTASPLSAYADVNSQSYLNNLGGQYLGKAVNSVPAFGDVNSQGYVRSFDGQFPSSTASPLAAYADVNSQSYINNLGGQYSGKAVNSIPAFGDVNSQGYVRSFDGQFPSSTASPLAAYADVSSQAYVNNFGGQFPSSTASPLPSYADVTSQAYIGNFGNQFSSTTPSPLSGFADVASQGFIGNYGRYSGVNERSPFARSNEDLNDGNLDSLKITNSGSSGALPDNSAVGQTSEVGTSEGHVSDEKVTDGNTSEQKSSEVQSSVGHTSDDETSGGENSESQTAEGSSSNVNVYNAENSLTKTVIGHAKYGPPEV